MTINVPKPEVLQRAFATIQSNLHAWDQDYWILPGRGDVPEENTCGTTACLAGWIALDEGFTVEQVHAMRDGVQVVALKALGFDVGEERTCSCSHDCGIPGADLTPEALEFSSIFWITSDADKHVDLSFTQEAFDAFRARVTELTGVEL